MVAAGVTTRARPVRLASRRFGSMGTTVEVITLPAQRGAAGVVEALFRSWHDRFSRFDPASELSALNAASGRPVVVSAALFEVVEVAIRAAAATDGIFDPTILARLIELGYDRTFAVLAPPTGAIDGAGLRPGGPDRRPIGRWRQVVVDHERLIVRLPRGVGLDLGGIAKGMAVDAAIMELEQRGVRPAAVNAGGDLAVLGLPPGEDGWTIGIELPEGERRIGLAEGALGTSSVGRRRWGSPDGDRHHLLDPRTGRPADAGLWSVSVVARRCAEAEVAAKVALILGPDDGPAFLERLGLPGLLVSPDGAVRTVGRWADPPPATETAA